MPQNNMPAKNIKIRMPALRAALISLIFTGLFHPGIQAQKMHFDHIVATSHGLSQMSATSIVQDSIGFIWIGTYDGLNRYDGYNFRIFRKDGDDPHSLSDSFIRTMLIDGNGTLWVGTALGGINRYDSRLERFVHYMHDPDDSASLSNNAIYALFQDHAGTIWAATWGGGLDKLVISESPEPGAEQSTEPVVRFVHFRHDPENANSPLHDKISSIFEDSRHRLWIGTRAGVSVLDSSRQTFIAHYRHRPDDRHSLSGDNITTIQEDRYGNMWIGTWDAGLNVYVPDKDQFIRYSHDARNPRSIGSNTIMELTLDHAGNLWIGTFGGGLNRIAQVSVPDYAAGSWTNVTFEKYQNQVDDPQSICGNSIYAIFEDRTHILWIGTDWNGLSMFDTEKNRFTHFQQEAGRPGRLNDNTIFALFIDSQDILWIGTQEGGLNAYHRKTDRFEHYQYDPDNPSTLSHSTVRAIYEDSHGDLWIGTSSGLNLFHRKSGTFSRYYIRPGEPASTHILTIQEDTRGMLLVGTLGNGLFAFDPVSKTFRNDRESDPPVFAFADNTVWRIQRDLDDTFWIGTITAGLYHFTGNGRLLHHFVHDADSAGLNDNTIFSLKIGRNGDIWAGTSVGLNRIERGTGPSGFKTTSYTQENGLYGNSVQGILEDDHGKLWLCNGDYLVVFDPETGDTQGYQASDRLQAGEFSTNAVVRDKKTGEMIVGSVNGFNIFHPDSIRNNTIMPNVTITDFKIFNRSIDPGRLVDKRMILEKSITLTDQIRLSYRDRVISFDFAALHFTSPENNQYAYRLSGFEKNWNFVTAAQRTASYTNLDPGRYTFHVKASNPDGLWNNRGKTIRIIITPPFWKTWWFRILGLMLIGGIIWAAFEFRLINIKKQRTRLEKLVEERTRDLKAANQELEAQKQQIETNAHALKRSNEELEQFAYVASHDLQEPLRMISSYARLLERNLQKYLDEDNREFLFYMTDGAQRMQTLITDLLVFSRVSTQAKPLEETDLNQLMKRVLQNLKVIIEEKNAKIETGALPTIMCDPIQFERLFQNLIGNAMKYCTSIPEIAISSALKDGHWQIAIKDNGIGFDLKYSHKIFGIFKRLHHRDEYSGTGIGLAVSKKIVERHGGEIWVESEEGKGSTFYFSVPRTDK
ncbi:hypothetical protein JW948_05550 [bacterium]|nr:hypothetical protein [bacterium]